MHVFDVGTDNKLSNGKLFSSFMMDGVAASQSLYAVYTATQGAAPG